MAPSPETGFRRRTNTAAVICAHDDRAVTVNGNRRKARGFRTPPGHFLSSVGPVAGRRPLRRPAAPHPAIHERPSETTGQHRVPGLAAPPHTCPQCNVAVARFERWRRIKLTTFRSWLAFVKPGRARTLSRTASVCRTNGTRLRISRAVLALVSPAN